MAWLSLASVANPAESYESHDPFTSSPTKSAVRIETVGEVRASLVCLLLTVLQSLYRTGSTWSTSRMSNDTYQPLALRLHSSSNLCQAYLECARSTSRRVRVHFLLQVRTICMYAASHHVIHLSRIGLDISSSVWKEISNSVS